jgi:hypothetical protein
MGNEQAAAIHLLSIQGKLAPATLEAARAIHNETAGAPPSVAAAQSLGDLSHMVYVPADGTPGQILFLDLWNKLEGLNRFFANPDVQEQAGRIFADRDPVVWAPAEGFATYHLPAPHGKHERIVAMVRGQVASRAAARELHNAIVAGGINQARAAGDLSHDVYFRLGAPDAPESLEFLAIDVWLSAAGMGRYYSAPEFLSAAQNLFVAPPTTSAWVHPAGDWVEW